MTDPAFLRCGCKAREDALPRAGLARLAATAVLTLGLSAAAGAADLRITFTNLAPTGGTGAAPLWVGFHNGSFDAFDVGAAASIGIERSAEDGNSAGLQAIFQATWPSGASGTLPGPPAFSGEVRSAVFQNIDIDGSGRYFSYAAMVVVSNDFFLGNDNPMQIDLSTLALTGGRRTIFVGTPGTVYDAGSEVNDFNTSLANAAFGLGGGQTGPNQGMPQGGVITPVLTNPYPSFARSEPGARGLQLAAPGLHAVHGGRAHRHRHAARARARRSRDVAGRPGRARLGGQAQPPAWLKRDARRH